MKKLLLLPIALVLSLSVQAQDKISQSKFEQERDKMWYAVDINHDGKITREEALKKANEIFAQQDLNKDGVITRDEMPTGIKKRKKKKSE